MRSDRQLTESYWPADTSEPLLDVALGELLRQAAAQVPQRVALVDAVADPAQRRRWTYAELLATAERTARALLLRFQPGARIAVCGPNCAEWVLLQHGISLAGMVLVPINPAYRAAEIEWILHSSQAACIFHVAQFRDNDLARTIAGLRPRLPGLREALLIAGFECFIAGADEAIALPRVTPDQLLQIQFTSGTTGVPKGACLHHRGTLNTSRFVARRAGFPEGGVWLNAMPMFHIAGPVVTAMATLASRGTYVLAPAFEPALMLELIESERANATLVVPTMIIALLDHADFPRRRLDSMKLVFTGATTVPAALVARTKQAFGCGVIILFGQTELNGVVCETAPEDSIEDQSQTLGRPLPQVELRISDPATGAVQPLDVAGEICVRGYQNMLGYCGLEEATRAAIGADGWLRTGDVATMDRRGYVRITGRLKDMIIRGGMNLYPREIEDVLFEHPAVAEVSVVGLPDEKWGEIVAAVIRPADPKAPPAPDALHAWCRERLAAHKAPAAWYWVEAYPLTPSGKVQKFMLQQWIEAGRLLPVSWSRSAGGEAADAGARRHG